MAGVASKLLHIISGAPHSTLARSVAVVAALVFCQHMLTPAVRRCVSWLLRLMLRAESSASSSSWQGGGDCRRVGVDARFWRQLGRVLRVLVPRVLCVETGLLALHTGALVARTLLSLHVAALDGRLVRCLVQRDAAAFRRALLHWLAVAAPAALTNASIRHVESRLALAFGSRLTRHAVGRYVDETQVYYRVGTLDTRLPNVDQCLTHDVHALAASLARLYSQLTKPLLDIVVILTSLYRLAGSSSTARSANVKGMVFVSCVIAATGALLRLISPPFGQLAAEATRRAAHLRHTHARLIAHAEEVAFCRGHQVELANLQRSYEAVVQHDKTTQRHRWGYVVVEQFFMKYVWSGCGMLVISLPLLASPATTASVSSQAVLVGDRAQYVSTSKYLLQSAADSVERLMSSYKELVELAGYTERIDTMLAVFDQVAVGKYSRLDPAVPPSKTSNPGIISVLHGTPQINGKVCVSEDGAIVLRDVPIVTPNCDVIVSRLSLTITPHMHLVITGPNGCGKSSLFRVLSGLWPVYEGELHTPPPHKLLYVSQRPYVSEGSLRDQLIYPHSQRDMQRRGFTDRHLRPALDAVRLAYLLDRRRNNSSDGAGAHEDSGWQHVEDWRHTLSGGEKQRLAMARLFYHRPQYALLDESTSAVSVDAEADILQAVKAANITLITVSHRPSLWRFHTHLLRFDGVGGWHFGELNVDKSGAMSDSKQNGGEVDDTKQNGGEVDDTKQNGDEVDDTKQNGDEVDGTKQNGDEVDDTKQNDDEIDDTKQNGDEIDDTKQNGGEVDDTRQNGGEVDDTKQNGGEVDDTKQNGGEVDDTKQNDGVNYKSTQKRCRRPRRFEARN